jgi:hypothetical protein
MSNAFYCIPLPRVRSYHLEMIEPRDVVIGVTCGLVAIAFGLIPGLFQNLADGVRTFGDALRGSQSNHVMPMEQPTGLAILGAALMALTIGAYLTQ